MLYKYKLYSPCYKKASGEFLQIVKEIHLLFHTTCNQVFEMDLLAFFYAIHPMPHAIHRPVPYGLFLIHMLHGASSLVLSFLHGAWYLIFD